MPYPYYDLKDIEINGVRRTEISYSFTIVGADTLRRCQQLRPDFWEKPTQLPTGEYRFTKTYVCPEGINRTILQNTAKAFALVQAGIVHDSLVRATSNETMSRNGNGEYSGLAELELEPGY